MKRLLALVLSLALALGIPVTGFAAEVQELGSDDFPGRVGSNYTVVSKTVKDKRNTYKVTGYYYASEGKDVFKLMNDERKSEGLKPLTWEAGLVQPAIQRALEQHVLISHTRPNGKDWSTVSNLANGENLAGGDDNARDVMNGWMNSPAHRSNILDPDFTSVAVVCVETEKNIFWVQLFHSNKKVDPVTGEVKDPDATKAESTKTETPAAAGVVTAKSIAADLKQAKVSGNTAALTYKHGDAGKINVDALVAASNWGKTNGKTVSITVNTPTASGKSTQGQLTLNPASFVKNKNALKTGVYADTTSDIAKKYKDAAVIRFEQSGSFGGTLNVGVKLNLTKLNTKSLMFYYYDAKTAKTTKLDIGSAGYTIDKNNYLRFATNKGGYIIVTDKKI